MTAQEIVCIGGPLHGQMRLGIYQIYRVMAVDDPSSLRSISPGESVFISGSCGKYIRRTVGRHEAKIVHPTAQDWEDWLEQKGKWRLPRWVAEWFGIRSLPMPKTKSYIRCVLATAYVWEELQAVTEKELTEDIQAKLAWSDEPWVRTSRDVSKGAYDIGPGIVIHEGGVQ